MTAENLSAAQAIDVGARRAALAERGCAAGQPQQCPNVEPRQISPSNRFVKAKLLRLRLCP